MALAGGPTRPACRGRASSGQLGHSALPHARGAPYRASEGHRAASADNRPKTLVEEP